MCEQNSPKPSPALGGKASCSTLLAKLSKGLTLPELGTPRPAGRDLRKPAAAAAVSSLVISVVVTVLIAVLPHGNQALG